MPHPPPRKRFIHLSTAIVLMFAAAGLIWANVYEDPKFPERTDYGWPLLAAMESQNQTGHSEVMTHPNFPIVLLGDVFIAIAILFAVWLVWEYLIRRRAARKES